MGYAQAILRGKFIVINVYFKKKERSQTNNLNLHKELEKEEQSKLKVIRSKEIIMIRAEINKIEARTILEKINENKGCFL